MCLYIYIYLQHLPSKKLGIKKKTVFNTFQKYFIPLFTFHECHTAPAQLAVSFVADSLISDRPSLAAGQGEISYPADFLTQQLLKFEVPYAIWIIVNNRYRLRYKQPMNGGTVSNVSDSLKILVDVWHTEYWDHSLVQDRKAYTSWV